MAYAFALVYIIRNNRGRVSSRSFQRFENEQEFEEFLEYSKKNLPDYPNLEIYEVSLQEAFEPEGRGKPNQMWCPFCGEWTYFRKHDDGYSKCEICHITDAEFYVRKYNKLGR